MQSVLTFAAALAADRDEAVIRAELAALGDRMRRELGAELEGDAAAPQAAHAAALRALRALRGLHFLSFFLLPGQRAGARSRVVLELSCDGPARRFRAELAQQPALLEVIFAGCEACPPAASPAAVWEAFLAPRALRADGVHIGCPGRTVEQIQSEHALRQQARAALRELHRAPGRCESRPLGSALDTLRGLRAKLPDATRPPQRPWRVRLGLNSLGLPAVLRRCARWVVPLAAILGGLCGLGLLWWEERLAWLALLLLPAALVALVQRHERPLQLSARGRRALRGALLRCWLWECTRSALGLGLFVLAGWLLARLAALPLLVPLLAALGLVGLGAALLAGVAAYLLSGRVGAGALAVGAWLAVAWALWPSPGGLALAAAGGWLLDACVLGALLLAVRRAEFEDSEDEIAWDLARLRDVEQHEDLFPQNHLATLSVIRAGALRLLLLRAALRALAFSSRFVFNRGDAGGVPTLHFTRFVVLPEERRLLFLSNYDGGFGAYLQDFATAQFVTAIWGHTRGFPRSFFLWGRGALDEQRFKAVARKAQLPTLGWWSAYPQLRVSDIDAASALREALFRVLPPPLPQRPSWWQRAVLAKWDEPASEAECDRAWRQI